MKFKSQANLLGIGIGIKLPISNKLKFFLELDGKGGLTDINKVARYP